MESVSSTSDATETKFQDAEPPSQEISDQWFSESFESLIPKIQEQWPDLAKQTLEATRGSLDEVINVIAQHSGINSYKVKEQLKELLDSATDRTKDLAESLEPLEKQLEDLLDDLNSTLRPRIEKPIKNRPLLAIGIAAAIGVILGSMLTGGRRS